MLRSYLFIDFFQEDIRYKYVSWFISNFSLTFHIGTTIITQLSHAALLDSIYYLDEVAIANK